MSAHDSNGYFVELGEYSLILAKANLSQRPRAVEDLREVWLGDNAGVEAALKEIKAEGEKGKAVALLRLKNRSLFSADVALGKKVNSAAAVESFLKESLGADAYPANWSWVNQKDGRAPDNGAPWLLDATANTATDEALGKITGWAFELLRCESASLALVGAVSNAARASQVTGPVLLCDVSENRSYLIGISNQGVTSFTTIPVGFDNLAEASQNALGLKFRGSAARLMFNESYDFSEAAAKIVEPLVVGIRGALPTMGAISPNQLVCSGVLARQTWLLQALASALNLKLLSIDSAAWATSQGLALGSKAPGELAPSWLGLLGAVAAYDPRNPGAVLPWNPVLTNTPVAPAPVIPAILQEPAPAPKAAAAVAPAPTPKAPEPAVIAPAPAVAPAPKPEPTKAAAAPAPAKPAEPAPPGAKAGVVITPPPKPLEPPKPITPAPKTPPPPAKPVEPKAAAKTEQKAASPAAAKAPAAKPEPAKPTPPAPAKPTLAPAPTSAAQKPGTVAPFPKKKNQMPMIIGIVVALLVLGGGGWFVVSNQKKQKAEQERHQREQDERLASEAAARRAAEEKARDEAAARKRAEEEAAQREVLAAQAKIEAEEKARQAAALQLINARGRLTLNTDPAGATVAVGELTPRPSPVDMKDLRLGKYNVTISLPGYETESRDVDIKANEVSDLGTIQLHRQIGSVEITSEPGGLDYELKPAGVLFANPADVRRGQTPATVADLPAGSYQITVNRPGWPSYTTTVTVERNSTVKARGSFVGGTVVVNSNPTGASVMRDQVQLGVTPLTLTDLQPADVTYTLTMRGLETATVSGRVEPGKTLTLNGTLLDADRVMRPSELDERPVPLAMVEPELTPALRTEGGSATVEFIVGKDGTPSEMKVLNTSNPAFGRACLAATAKWKFRPGVVRGKPVKTRLTVPFRMTPES